MSISEEDVEQAAIEAVNDARRRLHRAGFKGMGRDYDPEVEVTEAIAAIKKENARLGVK